MKYDLDQKSSISAAGMGTTEGFSQRFNKLLDEAGFKRGRSRATEVREFFNVGKSTAHRWLNQDYCPRKIVDVVLELLDSERLPGSISKDAIIIWLEKGTNNPFLRRDQKDTYQNDAGWQIQVHLAVNREAKKLGIDLYELSDRQLSSFFEKVLFAMEKSGVKEVDLDFIKSMIQEAL